MAYNYGNDEASVTTREYDGLPNHKWAFSLQNLPNNTVVVMIR